MRRKRSPQAKAAAKAKRLARRQRRRDFVLENRKKYVYGRESTWKRDLLEGEIRPVLPVPGLLKPPPLPRPLSRSERRFHARVKAIKASTRKRLYGDLLDRGNASRMSSRGSRRPGSRASFASSRPGSRPSTVGGPLIAPGFAYGRPSTAAGYAFPFGSPRNEEEAREEEEGVRRDRVAAVASARNQQRLLDALSAPDQGGISKWILQPVVIPQRTFLD